MKMFVVYRRDYPYQQDPILVEHDRFSTEEEAASEVERMGLAGYRGNDCFYAQLEAENS